MEKEKSSLDKFKEKYKKLASKYSLPDFKYINENFEVENIVLEDTDLILKKIRKQIMEKVFWHLRTLETFINPQSAPLFIFNIIKGFNEEDKKSVGKLYKVFAKFEVEAYSLEIDYNEEKEAELINHICKKWKDINEDLRGLYDSMKKSYDQEAKKQDKSYFG